MMIELSHTAGKLCPAHNQFDLGLSEGLTLWRYLCELT